MSAPYPAPTSPLYLVAVEMIRAVNTQEFDKLESYLANDFSHLVHPSTLRGPDANQRTGKVVLIDRIKQFSEGWVDYYGVDIDHPVNVVEGKNVIVLQLTSNGRMKNKGREYKQEYLHIMRFNDDNKCVSFDEWVDSAYMVQALSSGVMPIPSPDGRIANVEEAKKAHTAI